METKGERRLRKLRELIARKDIGSHIVLAEIADVSPESLDQIIKGVLLPPKKDGTQSPRSLGDKAARQIEDKLNLGRGWFDSDEAAPAMPRRIRRLVEQLMKIEDATELAAILVLAEAHAGVALERQAQSQGQRVDEPSRKRAPGR